MIKLKNLIEQKIQQVPEFWWVNTFSKICKRLGEDEVTEDNLKKSLQLIGKGTVKTSQGERYQYQDKNYFGYDLNVFGEVVRGEFEYSVAIYYKGGAGWKEGVSKNMRKGCKSVKAISQLIKEFEKEFVK